MNRLLLNDTQSITYECERSELHALHSKDQKGRERSVEGRMGTISINTYLVHRLTEICVRIFIFSLKIRRDILVSRRVLRLQSFFFLLLYQFVVLLDTHP